MADRGELRRFARRLAVLPLAGWLMLAAVGYLPTRRIGGPRAVEAMLAGQAVVFVVVIATLLPALRKTAAAMNPAARFKIALGTAVVRLLVTVAIAAVVAWRGVVQPTAFLIWLGIAYIVMIKIETWVLIAWNRRLEKTA